MTPMALPVFGGMLVALISIFVVPTCYCAIKQAKWKLGMPDQDFGTSGGMTRGKEQLEWADRGASDNPLASPQRRVKRTGPRLLSRVTITAAARVLKNWTQTGTFRQPARDAAVTADAPAKPVGARNTGDSA